MEEKKLPTIQEIESMEVGETEKSNALNVLLNQPPPKKWIKKRDGILYLPIDKVRYLLTKIFIDWSYEIKSVQVIANSVVVTVTLMYKNPLNQKIRHVDGIGAAPINTKSGKSAMDWDSIVHDSVHKCAPAASAFALKNAAKNIGIIFGRDLSKEDTIDYSTLLKKDQFKGAKATEV